METWADIFVEEFSSTEIALLWPDDLSWPHIGRAKGFGVYDDSIGFRDDGVQDADQVWRQAPIRMEMGHLFAPGRDGLISGDPTRLFRALESYRASHYFPHGYPDRFWLWYSQLAKQANRRLGYRFSFTEASWDQAAPPGQPVWFNLGLRNAGIAPNYLGGHVGIVISNSDRSVEAVYGGFNTADLEVASSQQRRRGYTHAEVTRLRIPVDIPADFPTGDADVSVFVRHPRDWRARDRSDRSLPVVGDWLDYPWEYYELPLANRVEHAENAFSYIIGQINVDSSATAEYTAPIASPVTLHRLSDEYGSVQGTLKDYDRTNDWLYRTATVPVGTYTPLAGTVTSMAYSSNKWTRSGQRFPELRDNFAHPDNGHEAVLTWQNTGSTTDSLLGGSVTVSGTVVLDSPCPQSGGNGVRFSILKNTDTILKGPITITTSTPIPFRVNISIAKGDQINIVVDAGPDQSTQTNRWCDGVSLDDLTIHRYPFH